MSDAPAHVEVGTARVAAAVGAAAWIVVAVLLRSVLSPAVVVAVSFVGLPLAALWAILVVEAGYRKRMA